MLLIKMQVSKTYLTGNLPICMKDSQDLKMYTPSNPPIVILRIYPKEMAKHVQEVKLQGCTSHAVGNGEKLEK